MHLPKFIRNRKQLTRYSSYLYLAMALLIVSVATASIFALSRSVPEETLIPEYSIPEFSFPTVEISLPSTDKPTVSVPETDESSIPSGPVFGEESNIEDSSSEAPVIQEVPRFYRPVDGEIVKDCVLESLVFSETMQDYRAHTGVDLQASVGASVYCFADGVVESVTEDPFYGTTVSVRHEHGLITVYSNLSPTLASGISVGSPIPAGAVLGSVGTSARAEIADAPHLHFEMMRSGKYINPKNELPD